ncbi:MAG: hypothetical protein ACLTQI_07340 [Slackia sp.]
MAVVAACASCLVARGECRAGFSVTGSASMSDRIPVVRSVPLLKNAHTVLLHGEKTSQDCSPCCATTALRTRSSSAVTYATVSGMSKSTSGI